MNSETELRKKFAPFAANLVENGMIWVAWPKKSSGVVTDLTFNNVQRIGLDAGLVDVKICAVNEIWSGLKFVYRLKDRVGDNRASEALEDISTGSVENVCKSNRQRVARLLD